MSQVLSPSLAESGPLRSFLWKGFKVLRRSRLLTFLIAGGLIFGLAPRPPNRSRISLAPEYLAALRSAEAQRQRGPVGSAEEVNSRAIEDEVLYHEALRLGLDQGDPLVRKHLIQKMLLLAEDLGGASRAPTEAELRTWFGQTRASWRQAPTLRLFHVFTHTKEDAAALRPKVLALSGDSGALGALGEAFPLSRDVTAPLPKLDDGFGPDFARAVGALPVGQWSDPLPSKYGWHLVRVSERQAERPLTFEEARPLLLLQYQIARRQAAVARYLEKAFPQYAIDVGGTRYTRYTPTPRLASRTAASGED